MNLSTARANLALGVALMVVIVLAGWFLLLGPTTAEVGDTKVQITDSADRNLLLNAQLGALRAQAEDLTVTRAAADDLHAMWPATADQPGFFRAVNAAAATAGYGDGDITDLSPSAPVAVPAGSTGLTTDPAVVVPTAPPAAGTSEGGVTSTPAPEATTVAVQTVTLTVEGTYQQAQVLLDQLERLPRSVLLQTVGLQPGAGDELSLTVTGVTFVAAPMRAPREVTPAHQTAAPGEGRGGASSAEVADGAP